MSGARHRRSGAVLAASVLGLGMVAATAPAVRAAPAVSLEQAFDNTGITNPATPGPGNFDGIGDSFSSTGLA